MPSALLEERSFLRSKVKKLFIRSISIQHMNSNYYFPPMWVAFSEVIKASSTSEQTELFIRSALNCEALM